MVGILRESLHKSVGNKIHRLNSHVHNNG